ncbi:hypothetical protein BB559_006622 [Furculomyces boomerangus]|uniref:Prokaryotic-type class I peptide chain release factors domain-containing protein n=1 Tax=Furculomyces boomerangus TaxID=61424 RepID=A0A2T9Y1L4_9FUNG|nr:hypothetical protein BB559_006622 [Furculomyces boomerangus]
MLAALRASHKIQWKYSLIYRNCVRFYSKDFSETELLPEEKQLITKWREKLNIDTINKDGFTFSFARSSGPGGQNVNKLNTKAMLRFKVDSQNWIPEYVREILKTKASSKINKGGEYVIFSEKTRSQQNNVSDCLEKLVEDLKMASLLPKDPTPEQIERVKKLKEIEKRKKIEFKKFKSEKKSDRRFKY